MTRREQTYELVIQAEAYDHDHSRTGFVQLVLKVRGPTPELAARKASAAIQKVLDAEGERDRPVTRT